MIDIRDKLSRKFYDLAERHLDAALLAAPLPCPVGSIIMHLPHKSSAGGRGIVPGAFYNSLLDYHAVL